MNASSTIQAGATAAGNTNVAGNTNGAGSRLQLDIKPVDSADAAQFHAMLDRQMHARGQSCDHDGNTGLCSRLTDRAGTMAADFKQDQQYVSKLLEEASRTGDSMQLMKAMMALNDYQMRVQTVTKTVSKATQSFEQLTKLQ